LRPKDAGGIIQKEDRRRRAAKEETTQGKKNPWQRGEGDSTALPVYKSYFLLRGRKKKNGREISTQQKIDVAGEKTAIPPPKSRPVVKKKKGGGEE